MRTTAELLTKALEFKKASMWCKDLNITEAALSKAKNRGHLSPTLAGVLAIEMGADAVYWTAIAAAEAEPRGALRERLERALERQITTAFCQFSLSFWGFSTLAVVGLSLLFRDT